MVQEKVLDSAVSDELSVHVVWLPVLKNDSYEAALKAQLLIPDARATHYWDGEQDLGIAYAERVELPSGRDLAWDIYFVFERGTRWEKRLPYPTDWAHQLGLDERHLKDGSKLQGAVRTILAASE